MQTERLILRPLEMNDVDTITDLLQGDDIHKNIQSLPYPYTHTDAENFIQSTYEERDKGTGYIFGIIRREDGVLIGVTGIHPKASHRRAELGYWLGKKYWGQGYMTEVARRIIQYGFEELDLNRIFARCYTHNVASAKVMQKAGMSFEGTVRQEIYHAFSGEYKDCHYYSILKGEWQP